MRCKMTCGSKVKLQESPGGYCLGFYAVYAGSEENDKYFQATPSANCIVQTVNESAARNFEVGKSYYVDFTLAVA